MDEIAALDAESAEVLGKDQGAAVNVYDNGWRRATTRRIAPRFALGVGMPAATALLAEAGFGSPTCPLDRSYASADQNDGAKQFRSLV